jgi:hypothetical protein
VADVLQKLKEELAAQQVALAEAKRAVQHLQIAIAAIERDEAETKKQIEHQRPTNKRGYLIKVVIEALRDGIGTVSPIVHYAKQRGIKTTGQSVSNAIYRMQHKGKIRYDPKKQIWILVAESSSPSNGEDNKVSAPDVPSEAVIQTVGMRMGAHS